MQDYLIRRWTHQEIADAYAKSSEEHLSRSLKSAFSNAMNNDIGVANINVRTAIDSLKEYANLYKNSDPLNLKRYLGDYNLMVKDLTDSQYVDGGSGCHAP